MKIDEIKTGDILLSQGHGIVSAGIRAATDSDFSHVAMAFKQSFAGDSHLAVVEAIGKGVVCRPFDIYLNDRHHEVSVYRLRDRSVLNEQKLWFDAFTMLGHDYNTSGIVKFFIDKASKVGDYEGLHARFCSEVVSWLYRMQKGHGHALETVYHGSGVDLVPEHADRATSPGDIANSKLLECIGTIDVPERPKEIEEWEVESE